MEMVKDMERKVIKTGNSLGANMTDALKKIGAEKGIHYQLRLLIMKFVLQKNNQKWSYHRVSVKTFLRYWRAQSAIMTKRSKG